MNGRRRKTPGPVRTLQKKEKAPMRFALLTALITLALHVGGPATVRAGETKVLRYSAIPDQNSTELIEKFKPLSEYLSQKLGVSAEYVPARDYQASIEMFKNGDILLAWFGGLTGVQARAKVPGAMAIAQGDVDPKYYSYFIANKETGLTKSEKFPMEIANFTFTFGSEQSTSGRLMPEYFIRQETGKSPAEFFKNPVSYSKSHDQTAELVASGQFQVGVMNYKVYEKRVKEKKTDPEAVVVIWQTPTYADYNWTAHPDLEKTFGAGFTQKLQDALVAIDDPKLLAAHPRDKMVPAKNEEYEKIRQVAEALGMLR
jgi:phosphonate transport system substrate-binding protein